jgi:hypothetical protein
MTNECRSAVSKYDLNNLSEYPIWPVELEQSNWTVPKYVVISEDTWTAC